MKDGEEEKRWGLSNSQTLRRSTDRKADHALRPFLTGGITDELYSNHKRKY